MMADILIFCDGGLGNRINALASGLAIARHFGLSYCVHWPINNWCAAPFHKIFANRLNISAESISQLKGKLDDAVMLLHDEIASNSLGVKFDSAYRFKNLQEFDDLAIYKDKSIFYYPAVIPNWVPEELVHQELKFLKFDSFIVREVKEFISKTMPGPFYGLHLRRTDLNVGLDDLEVFNLAKSHPEDTFFVCSDDPLAERLAAGHPNVFRREKKFQIEKSTLSGDWLAQTHDDDGRLYYGNIRRKEEAVVEGAIDMLILAHSQIVGFSGSTFQKIARTLGMICPVMVIERPVEFSFFSEKDVKDLSNTKLQTIEDFIKISDQLIKEKNVNLAIKILENAIEKFNEEDYSLMCFKIGLIALNNGIYKKSMIYLESAVKIKPYFGPALLYLTLCYYKNNKLLCASRTFNAYKLVKSSPLIDTEEYLYKMLDNLIYQG